MKILRLSFKNLNSLAGIWEIDFSHPDYVSSGIFAITGPTGAGKSTILDAICLALYGQTPRLSRITQSDNEIMARQTGECFAEVEFETAKGRFRCHWSQHRSRKLADGQLQSPRHEIAVAETGVILESKLRAVIDKVEEVTGMDFDRFTRSMLLAQGGFAAFLQARPDDRAPILEQITGTAIYSRISMKVHERTSEERKKLAELRAELDGIVLLTPAEAEVLCLEKATLQEQESALAAAVQSVRAAQAWRERIATLEVELQRLDQELLAFAMRKEAAEPELERLALAARALNLGGDHAHLVALRAQQVKEQGERATAAARLPQLQLEWQTAFEAVELAVAGLTAARLDQAREAELIRATRTLDIRLGETNAQMVAMTAAIEKSGRQNNGYRQAIKACNSRIVGMDGELRGIAVFLEEQRDDAALAGALTGIEQQLRALKALDKQRNDSGDRLKRQTGLIESAAQELSRTESVWQESRQQVATAAQQLATIAAANAALLAGRDIAAWRDEAESLTNRQHSLTALRECVARLDEITPQLAALKLRGDELEQRRKALAQKEGELASACELREQLVRRLQDNIVLLNRVQSLEDDRKQLVDGAPCPLCGSADHPYATGNIPQADETRVEMDRALGEAKLAMERLSQVKQDLASTAKDIEQAEQRLAELQKRLLDDEALRAQSFAELGLAGEAAAWSAVIGADSDACDKALLNLRNIIRDAERNEQQERIAQAAHNRLKDALAGDDKARLAAQLGHEAALAEQTRLESEAAALAAECGRVQAEVESSVATYGYFEVIPVKSAELLSVLTARSSAYVVKAQANEQLAKARTEAVAERGKQEALLAEAEKALAETEQLLRDKGTEREALVEQRLEQYGERNPDIEEKRLADLLDKAATKREAAQQEQQRLQGELDAARQQVERLTLSIAGHDLQASQLEQSFAGRLTGAGFADEAAFIQACLPQERFDALAAMAATLRNEETVLHTSHRDRAVALASELDKNLTDKPLELLREECNTVNVQLSELQKGLGALEQRLHQHAEQQQRHQGRLQLIELQRGECGRWERLHSLIGAGDGKKFRNFAQGLTFELMVAHANRQLQKMSDRYILVRDNAEPLELNVIDNYQAGEIRSTKNLSGGESFIASLALSLGLSSMASRNVRVDSLFLDEGFGTLDEDALETALETLSGLQQEGKLIGIISHVPALKERIGTQIQVESGSAGRSSLSGPGCRRVVA
jgi:exonuclease SbcC